MTSLKYFCEDAIEWLISAGLVHKVFRIQKFEQPLKFYDDFDCFKLYVNDLGLLGLMAQAPASEILGGNSAFSSYKGSFTEQFENASYQEISLRSQSHVEGWYPELVEGSKPPHLV